MSQTAQFAKTLDRIAHSVDIAEQPSQFLDQDAEIATCQLHHDPYDILGFVQQCLYRVWRTEARNPHMHIKPFMQWYCDLDIPREPAELYPWVQWFGTAHMTAQRRHKWYKSRSL